MSSVTPNRSGTLRLIAGSFALVLASTIGCARARREVKVAVAPAAARAPVKTWPVPWSRTFKQPVLSPDGYWAVVRDEDPQTRQDRPVLFRVQGPPGPVVELNPLFGQPIVDVAWAPDSTKLLIRADVYGSSDRSELGIVDLATSRVSARWLVDFGDAQISSMGWVGWATDMVAISAGGSVVEYDARASRELGRFAIGKRASVEFSGAVPLAAMVDRQGDEAGVRIFDLLSRRPSAFFPVDSVREMRWSRGAAALAVRAQVELVVWRPDRPVVRVAIGGDHGSVIWGKGAGSIAKIEPPLNCPDCRERGRFALIAFDANNGQPVAAERFESEPPSWSVNADGGELFVESLTQPIAQALPATADVAYGGYGTWLGDSRFVLSLKDETAEVDVTTGQVRKMPIWGTNRDDEKLLCRDERWQLVRVADGTEITTFPRSCREAVPWSVGDYFIFEKDFEFGFYDRTGQRVAEQQRGRVAEVSGDAHGVSLKMSDSSGTRCARFDAASGQIWTMPPVPTVPSVRNTFQPSECSGAAFGLVYAQSDGKGSSSVYVWSPRGGYFVAADGAHTKNATEFCRGEISANQQAVACAEQSRSGTRVHVFDGSLRTLNTLTVLKRIALSPDGRTFAGVDQDLRLTVFATGQIRGVAVTLTSPRAFVQPIRLRFSPDSRWIALETQDVEGLGPAYLVPNQLPLAPITLPGEHVLSVEFGPAGRKVAVLAEHVFVFDLETKTSSGPGPTFGSLPLYFSADDETLVVDTPAGAFGGLAVLRSGQTVKTGERVIRRGPFTVKTAMGEIELWSHTGERIATLPADIQEEPYVSPSGTLAFELANPARLIHLKSRQTLSFSLFGSKSVLGGAFRAPSGWFAGDVTAFEWLRFARGRNLSDAIPLNGVDLAAELARPDKLRDFLDGREDRAPKQTL